MFLLDIETLDIESSAAVLSAAVLHFDYDTQYSYDELIKNACFVKFNMKEQIQKFHRTTDKSTIAWWKSQSEDVKKVSLFPLASDSHLVDGLLKIKDYVDSHEGERIVWVRGTLDQITFNSLCKSAGVAPIFPFKNYMEVRTAINLLKDSAKNGYCSIPNFDKSRVMKHNPIHDCAYDVIQILKGE